MEQQEAYLRVISVSSHSHTGPAPLWGRHEGLPVVTGRLGMVYSRAP